MLDTVREYALEIDGNDVRDRHGHYYADLAERIGPQLVGPHRIAAVRELVAEHENLRAALAHSLEGDAEVGFRIAARLRLYWTTATRGREIRTWLEHAFAENEALGTPARVGALLVLGRELMNAGDYGASRTTCERVVEAGRALGCWSDAAVAFSYLAWLSAAEGDHDSARRFAEECIELARRGEDSWAERQGLAMVAATLINRGDYTDAAKCLDESLALARELDDPSTLVLALGNSGYGAIASGDLVKARSHLEEALELTHQLDEPPATVSILQLLAWEASLAGEPQRARRFLRNGLELLRAGGRRRHLVDVLNEAALELETSEPRVAVRILAAADADYAAGGTRRGAPATKRYEPLHGRLAAALGQEEFDRLSAEGEKSTLDEAVVEALAALD